ncbi:MAG: peptide-binding protein [Patescibacteria group bacterium]|nr:MAG: peptide-binding protein [Patescibacteria group bacterium]
MSFSLRYSLKLIQAFLLRFKSLILIGFLMGVLIFFLLKFVILPFITLGKTERIGIVGKYRIETLPNDILSLISYGLSRNNSDGSSEPMLAKSWETPDKGKTWIFYLNENLFWQDGTKIKSSDISYNFSDVEIEKPDEKTIIFKLKNPFSPFPTVVSKPIFKKGLLGAGDWKVKKISISGGYVEKLILTDKNKNQKIFRFYPTEDRLKLALKMGEVDIIENLLDPTPFDKWSSLKIKENINKKQIVTIFFNSNDKFLSEKVIRQALYYAIDKNKLSSNSAYSPIYPESWAYNPLIKHYDFDLDKAKKMINSLPAEAKKDLSINLTTTPALLDSAEKIVKMWKELGINSSVQISSIIPDNYQALLVIFEPPVDPDQYPIWHSTQTNINYSQYKNPRIDSLLEEGRSKLDLEDRKKIYFDFQRFLLEEAPAAFLYHPTFYTISRKK